MALLAAPVLLVWYFVLAYRHSIIARARERADALVRMNEEALQRIARDWERLPLRHRRRAEPDHPYAADLDLFGRASLFHLLDTTSTRMGEETLAHWLLHPGGAGAVLWRQGAVQELAPNLDFRQDLALFAGIPAAAKADPEPLLEWAEGAPWLARRPVLLWGARIGPLLLGALAIAHLAGWVAYPFWALMLLFNAALWQLLGRDSYGIISRVRLRGDALLHYAAALELIAASPFHAPALKQLQAEITTGGHAAHVLTARLSRLSALFLPRSAMLYLFFQVVTLWDIHGLALLERWQMRAGGRVRGWLTALGGAEALSALAGLAYDNPDWALPDLDPEHDRLAARDLGHPLLAGGVRVANDITIGPPGTFLLVTGSNMSGKSTLLRAIGANTVLAGAGGPVCASSYYGPPVALWTSMRLQDSLAQGVSYFMAELQRLKAIVDAANAVAGRRDTRFLYLLDEILQGTNTAERQIAARRIISHLLARGAIGAVSTHDLSLGTAEELLHAARPVHFTEEVHATADGPTMTFDYRLRPGIATSTNALKLMEIVGLDIATPARRD
jgi:hypothetical protein